MRTGNVNVRVQLKGVNKVNRRRADGTVVTHYYHRATGRRLEGEPGTQAFFNSYAEAVRQASMRSKGTLSELIRKFEGAAEFDAMRESTRTEYKRKFKVVDREWGSCPTGALADRDFRRDVLAWRDKIAKATPREADNLVSAIARLLSWALDRGEITANVLDKVHRVYASNRSELIWLPEHIDAFTKAASPELGIALMLALHTGQRQGDLLALPWSAYDGAKISLRQSKKGRSVVIPCTAALKRVLDGIERSGLVILTSPKAGRPWNSGHFRHAWKKAARRAGIEKLHFHDLRGTAVTMLAEAGCTAPEIASITGHALDHVGRILDVYLARTAPLAEAAIFKLEQYAAKKARG